MVRDAAYREAERRIEEERRSGANELYLAGLGLTELPESLGQLTQLRLLRLHENRLKALPESLGNLTQLLLLDLQRNQLTALPRTSAAALDSVAVGFFVAGLEGGGPRAKNPKGGGGTSALHDSSLSN